MITLSQDEVRAVLSVGAVLFGLSGAGGYTAGRMTAPVPPVAAPAVVEVRVPYIVEVPVVVPAPAPEPPKVGEDEPRTIAPPSPPVAVRKAVPQTKAPAPIVAKEKRERPQPKPAVKAKPKQRGPTASECAQLRGGIDKVGRVAVKLAARARGYSADQVDGALSACGF